MIKEITLKNFRNHKNVHITGMSSGMNVFCGKNGEGKTNLLEALYILTSGKSFRTSQYSPMIMEGEERAYAALLFSENTDHKTEVLLEKGGKKSFRADGYSIKKLSELFSLLPAVVFSPEDIKIVKENPGARRRFLDAEISRLRPSYIEALKKYKSIISQKNRALKTKNAEKLIDIYNEQLVMLMAVIFKNREKYIKRLASGAGKILSDMGKKMEFSAALDVDIDMENTEKSVKNILFKVREREIEEGHCIFGPHRTDMKLSLFEKDTRIFASQGEARTLALAMKFAAADIIEETLEKKPVMILDDVFSYLDENRQKWVINKCKGRQSFLAIASETPSGIPGDKIYFLKNSRIFTQKQK